MKQAWQDILTLSRDEHDRFADALSDPEAAQLGQLRGILNNAADSAWGRRHRVRSDWDIHDYQRHIPPADYADHVGAIQALVHGEADSLYTETTLFMETTAGSHGGGKLVPYNASSLAALQRGLYPWLHDLLHHHPRITQGHTYWSISPARQAAAGTPAIPTGIVNDALYFGEPMARRFAELMIAPAMPGEEGDFDAWRTATLCALLACEDLSFISIWSPTFLSDLLQRLQDDADTVLAMLHGQTSGARMAHVAAVLKERADDSPLDTRRLWPDLTLVSCWTQGSAQQFLPALKRHLPGVSVQGKGLLATEGMVTLPLANAAAPVLAINSGFYEFIDAQGRVLTCMELHEGETYEVLLTTWGGLYRYRLGDRVRVRGWLEKTPLLDFIGRAGLVSDLCGEKLDEVFACEVLQEDCENDRFAMLLPQSIPRGYALVLDAAQWSKEDAQRYTHAVEKRLQGNPQYAYARHIGQLQPLAARRVSQAWPRYRTFMLSRGMRLGDIKPPVLGIHAGLDVLFAGEQADVLPRQSREA